MSRYSFPSKIVSGGQTGIDRAALDVALELGITHGGWCPRGRLAEDGPINTCYHLMETDNQDYITRTKFNVRDSDGTLILKRGKLEGGTAATVKTAKELDKPLLIIDMDKKPDNQIIYNWLQQNNIHILNIAGPRESKRPGIYQDARDILLSLFEGHQVQAS